MVKWKALLMTILAWIMDPASREHMALRRAEQRGLERMKDPLRRALERADELGIQFYSERLEQYRQVLKSVAPAIGDPPPLLPVEPLRGLLPTQSPTSLATVLPGYVVSSAALAQAYAHLTRSLPGANEEPEWMLAVTGVKQAGLNLRSLEHLIEVRLSQQSAATAAFDMQDFGRIAVMLHEHGLALHAIFHSHRFAGHPQPSSVDWRLQDFLDQGGYPAIQAVFSEDGYIRFFARRPFTITVTGKGVECEDQDAFLYRLVHFGTLPQPGDAPAHRRAGDALRPIQVYPGR